MDVYTEQGRIRCMLEKAEAKGGESIVGSPSLMNDYSDDDDCLEPVDNSDASDIDEVCTRRKEKDFRAFHIPLSLDKQISQTLDKLSDDKNSIDSERLDNLSEVEESSDSEEVETLADSSDDDHSEEPVGPIYCGQDGVTEWKCGPTPQNKPIAQSEHLESGPTAEAKAANSELDIFKLFFTDNMIESLVECTNLKINSCQGNYSRERDVRLTDPMFSRCAMWLKCAR